MREFTTAYEGRVERYEGEDYYAVHSRGCQGCRFVDLEHCIKAPCETKDEGKPSFIYVTKIEFITRRLTK